MPDQYRDWPGGVILRMPDCATCGHPEVSHNLNTKDQRTSCSVGPINDLMVQCRCKRYRADKELP